MTVAAQFLSDFEKSGIHLPQAERDRFVNLSDQILSLGRTFTTPESEEDADADHTKMVPVSVQELNSWNSRMAIMLQEGGKANHMLYVHANSAEGHAIRREHPEQSVRQRFYEAAYTSTPDRLHTLDDLLRKRGELAKLVGKRSWADVALGDKMAKTPGNYMNKLQELS